MEENNPWLTLNRLDQIHQMGERSPAEKLAARLETVRIIDDFSLAVGQDTAQFLDNLFSPRESTSVAISKPYESFEYVGEGKESRMLRYDWEGGSAYFILLTDMRQKRVNVGNIILGFEPNELSHDDEDEAVPFYMVEPDGSTHLLDQDDISRALDEFEKAVAGAAITRKEELGLTDEDAILLETRIGVLSLNKQTRNKLLQNGINTLGDLAYGHSEQSLRALDRIGYGAVRAVKEALEEKELRLRTEEELEAQKEAFGRR